MFKWIKIGDTFIQNHTKIIVFFVKKRSEVSLGLFLLSCSKLLIKMDCIFKWSLFKYL